MTVRNTMRALPTMLRVGFAEAVAYRAELVVWVLATTMPLIMMALWLAVARDAPVGRMGEAELTAYFLASFIVRQLAGSWVSWQINFEVRDGTLAMRLLRPVHPLVAYTAEQLASVPMRGIVSIPVAVLAMFWVGTSALPRDPLIWLTWAVSMLGAWLLTLLAQFVMGCLALFLESSLKVMDIYLALYFVFSGYVVPVELFPPSVRAALDWLPFRYQLGLPVELMTGAHDLPTALRLLGQQWILIALSAVVATLVWRRGVGRFAAYGG